MKNAWVKVLSGKICSANSVNVRIQNVHGTNTNAHNLGLVQRNVLTEFDRLLNSNSKARRTGFAWAIMNSYFQGDSEQLLDPTPQPRGRSHI